MRILNENSNKSMKNALLLLTVQEASKLRDDLERLISQKVFNERTKKLITHDEGHLMAGSAMTQPCSLKNVDFCSS